MNRDDLQRLSKDDLIELVLRLQCPDKTSRTSSKPPSTDRKERREQAKPGGAQPGHEGHSRKLCETPDAVEDHEPTHCLNCLGAFGADAERELIGEYDEIELPPVQPFVRRHRRFAICCEHCRAKTPAPLPAVTVGTPFGPRIHALAIYLKTRQALSYERLQQAFSDLFGLTISQGALMNMFARTARAFDEKKGQALAVLRKASFVASDETGVRIEGVNAYHWAFCCKSAVVHMADFTRSAEVVRKTMNGHQPRVWTSDRYSAQQRPGTLHQTLPAQTLVRPRVRFRRRSCRHGAIDASRQEARTGTPDRRYPDGFAKLLNRQRTHRQDRSRQRPVARLLLIPRRSRADQQRLRASPEARRHPAQSHQRLSRHVGRPI